VADFPHLLKEGRAATLARLMGRAGSGGEESGRYDARGRLVLDGYEAFMGWARAHNLAVVA
jgi:hypothetical protein